MAEHSWFSEYDDEGRSKHTCTQCGCTILGQKFDPRKAGAEGLRAMDIPPTCEEEHVRKVMES